MVMGKMISSAMQLNLSKVFSGQIGWIAASVFNFITCLQLLQVSRPGMGFGIIKAAIAYAGCQIKSKLLIMPVESNAENEVFVESADRGISII